MREYITAFLMLYIRPIAAVSRILDHGRLWFAILASLGVSLLFRHGPGRGILADVYLSGRAPIERCEVENLYTRFYAGNPFVTVFTDRRVPSLPAVEKPNNAQLKVAQRDGVIHILSALDNLGKGAAGQAVQNMNIMLGLPEERGLDARTAVG